MMLGFKDDNVKHDKESESFSLTMCMGHNRMGKAVYNLTHTGGIWRVINQNAA